MPGAELPICEGHSLSLADGAVVLGGVGTSEFFERAEEVEDYKVCSWPQPMSGGAHQKFSHGHVPGPGHVHCRSSVLGFVVGKEWPRACALQVISARLCIGQGGCCVLVRYSGVHVMYRVVTGSWRMAMMRVCDMRRRPSSLGRRWLTVLFSSSRAR